LPLGKHTRNKNTNPRRRKKSASGTAFRWRFGFPLQVIHWISYPRLTHLFIGFIDGLVPGTLFSRQLSPSADEDKSSSNACPEASPSEQAQPEVSSPGNF
jgi:hypothetical protein